MPHVDSMFVSTMDGHRFEDQLLRILKSVFLNFLPLICDSMILSEVTNAAISVSWDDSVRRSRQKYERSGPAYLKTLLRCLSSGTEETMRYLSQVRGHTHRDSNRIILNTSRPFLFLSWAAINIFRRSRVPKSNISLSALIWTPWLLYFFQIGYPRSTGYCTGLHTFT